MAEISATPNSFTLLLGRYMVFSMLRACYHKVVWYFRMHSTSWSTFARVDPPCPLEFFMNASIAELAVHAARAMHFVCYVQSH